MYYSPAFTFKYLYGIGSHRTDTVTLKERKTGMKVPNSSNDPGRTIINSLSALMPGDELVAKDGNSYTVVDMHPSEDGASIGVTADGFPSPVLLDRTAFAYGVRRPKFPDSPGLWESANHEVFAVEDQAGCGLFARRIRDGRGRWLVADSWSVSVSDDSFRALAPFRPYGEE